MKVAFVCGPYRGLDPMLQRRNISRARTVAEWLWTQGYAVICPHTNSAWFDGIIAEEGFRRGYQAILARADLVVLVDGWEQSEGSAGELRVAAERNIPVYVYRVYDGQPRLRPFSPDPEDAA